MAIFPHTLRCKRLAGADVQLPALKQVSGGPVLLEGDGTGSTLDISALTSFSGTNGLNSFSALQASDGGTVLDASLDTLNEVDLAFDPTATFDTNQITSFTNGGVLNGQRHAESAAMDGRRRFRFRDQRRASLTLPVLTSYKTSTITNTNYWSNGFTDDLLATGAGTELSMPELASITANAGYSYYAEVQAFAGGDVELPALNQVEGPSCWRATALQDKLDISALTSFTGVNALNSFSALQASNGGTIVDASLATLNEVDLALDQPRPSTPVRSPPSPTARSQCRAAR